MPASPDDSSLGVEPAPQAAGPGPRLSLVGELDVASADGLVERVQTLDGHGADLVLDLARLDFIDAAGIRGLLTVKRLVEGRGGELLLSRPRPLVRRLLTLADLDTVLPVSPAADGSGCRGQVRPAPRSPATGDMEKYG